MQAHWVVLEPLAHLLAVLSQDKAIADQALEGWLVKERGGEHHEGVEPAACLVQPCRAGIASQARAYTAHHLV